jgi:NADH dehydrogenase (ubiquinone) 1 alpha subcomplex subunit 5
LIYLYSTTLQKLQTFPESSAYRQSVEALTRHRLQIIESQKPAGFDAWLERVRKTVGAEPERFAKLQRADGSFTHAAAQQKDGTDNARGEEWDGEERTPTTEGPARTPQQEAEWHKIMAEASETTEKAESDFYNEEMKWESEPALDADQYVCLNPGFLNLLEYIANFLYRISHVEQQIGAGLIEEVIQVAEAELKLVDELAKAKV